MLSYADGLLFRQIEALAETFNTAGRVKNALPATDGPGTASLHTSNGDVTVTVSN